MTRLGKFWTASIAYVALATGAGLSVMYNVLQTIAIRGTALELADIITAVAMPGVVVLMVELFVSRVWIGTPWYMQAVRVAATVGIGGVAMRASWTHGHDWMLSHGHTADVAILWPLAIDLLAILATALILAGRRGKLPTGQPAMANLVHTLAAGQDMAIGHAWSEPDPVATQPLSPDGQQLATETEAFLAATPAAPRAVTKRSSVPSDVLELYRAWDPSALSKADADALIAAHYDRSVRVARRWRSEALGTPTSGGPVS